MVSYDEIVLDAVVPQLKRRGFAPNTDDQSEMRFIIETAKARGVSSRTLSSIIETVRAHRAFESKHGLRR